jgi:hypothetical protein
MSETPQQQVVDFSILWPKFQESMATGARKCRGQLLELGI